MKKHPNKWPSSEVRLYLARRVAQGVRFLDRTEKPNWERKIDLERLALEQCNACVLGQLDGDFEVGLNFRKLDFIQARKYGFTLDFDDLDDRAHAAGGIVAHQQSWWAVLTDLWKSALRGKRRYLSKY